MSKSSIRPPKGKPQARPKAAEAKGRAPASFKGEARQIVEQFRSLILETADLYGIKPHQVVRPQFDLVAKGRLSSERFRIVGTFATVREFCFPSPKSAVLSEDLAAIRRLLEKAA